MSTQELEEKVFGRRYEHLEPEVTDYAEWWKITNKYGETLFIPTEAISKDELHEIYSVETTMERVTGYGARLSAPGYLDCTEWTVFEDYEDALEYLAEQVEDLD